MSEEKINVQNAQNVDVDKKKKKVLFGSLLSGGIVVIAIIIALLLIFLLPDERKYEIDLDANISQQLLSEDTLIGEGSYKKGDSVTIVAEGIEGYRFIGWTLNGQEISDKNEYTFTVDETTEGEYIANYTKLYKIEIESGDLVVLIEGNKTQAIEGEEVSFTIEGQDTRIEKVYIQTAFSRIVLNDDNDGKYTFKMLKDDIEIVVDYNQEYLITVDDTCTEFVNIDIQKAIIDEKVYFTVESRPGYRLDFVKYNDIILQPDNDTYMFRMPASNVKIIVKYVQQFEVNLQSEILLVDENQLTGSGIYDIDTEVKLTMPITTIDKNGTTYRLVGLKLNDSEEIIAVEGGVYAFILTNASAGTYTAIYEQRYRISVDDSLQPYINLNNVHAYQHDEITLETSFKDDIYPSSITVKTLNIKTVNGQNVEYTQQENNKYSFTMPASDVTLSIARETLKIMDNDYMIVGSHIMGYNGDRQATEVTIPGSYRPYIQDSDNMVQLESIDAYQDLFQAEGSPLGLTLMTGHFSYKTNNSTDFIEVDDILTSESSNLYTVFDDPSNYPLTLKFDEEYSITQDVLEEWTQLLEGDMSETLMTLLLVPAMHVAMAPTLISQTAYNIACMTSFTYQIGDSQSVDVDITNAMDIYYNFMKEYEFISYDNNANDEFGEEAINNYNKNRFNIIIQSIIDKLPITIKNIKYGTVYLCEGKGVDITTIEEGLFQDFTQLEKATLQEGITTISGNLFQGCTNLKSVSLPSTLTSISSSLFSGCNNLEYNRNLDNPKDKGLYLGNEENPYLVLMDVDDEDGEEITTIDFISDRCKIIYKIPYYVNNLTIPASIKSISSGASSDELDNIYYEGDLDQWTDMQFGPGWATVNNLYFKGKLVENIYLNKDVGNFAFYGIKSIKSINFGQNVSDIGHFSFTTCNNLSQVTFEQDSKLTSIGLYAFWGCSNLTSITLPESLGFLELGSFAACSKLTDVNLSSTLKMMGPGTFAECSNLTSIYLPSSIQFIGFQAFYNCNNLQAVTFEEGSLLTSVESGTFYFCNKLTSITIPKGVTSIGFQAFYNCTNLTTVDFGDNPQLQTIGDSAFYSCRMLTSIFIPEDMTKITSTIFTNCSSLTEIYYGGTLDQWLDMEFETSWLPSDNYVSLYFDNELVTEITINKNVPRNAFCNISSIFMVTIDEGVTEIGEYAFNGSTGLTSITLPSGLSSINEKAFYGCYSLAVVYNNSSLNIIKGTTYHGYVGYYAYEVLGPGEELPGTIEVIDNVRYYINEITGEYTVIGATSKATNITIKKQATAIRPGAFYNNREHLQSITFEDGSLITSIDAETFYNCQFLTTIDFGDNSKLQSIGDGAFSLCYSLKSINLPSSLTSIGASAFKSCTSLTSITIPEGVISIGDNAFESCYSLALVINNSTNLTITEGGTDNGGVGYYSLEVVNTANGENMQGEFKVIDNVLYYINEETDEYVLVKAKRDISEIVIKKEVTAINHGAFLLTTLQTITFEEGSSLTSIGIAGFELCPHLTSITIPEGVTSIGDWAFTLCASLKSINLPSSLTSIGDGAFELCVSLKSINLPSGLTSIGSSLFALSGLTSITIPEGVTEIGDHAFQFCPYLTSITLPSTLTSIGYLAFWCSGDLSTIVIESEDIYKLATSQSSAGYLLQNATKIKVPKSIVDNCDNDYLENTSKFTASEEGDYIVFTKRVL